MTRPCSPLARALSAIAIAALSAAGLAVGVAAPAAAAETVVFSSIPETLAPNYASLGGQAYSQDEIGDYLQLAGTDRDVTTVTVGMSNWACETGGGATCATTPGSSFEHPITVNIYAADTSGSEPVAGALIASVTEDKTIPYRPSVDPTCNGGTAWRADNGNCYNGFAFTLDFDFGGVTVPDDIIVGVAYNTQSHGAAPLGVEGPYDSLNVALVPVGQAPGVGTDGYTEGFFWDTSAAFGGDDTFRASDYYGASYNSIMLRVSVEEPVTNAACTSITTADLATDLDTDGWDFSQTRAAGSNTFVAGGLLVETTEATSLGKAAGYKAIDIALADVGDFAIALEDVTGVPPSLQLGVDLDDDGVQDGYLVYEETYYGQNLWASSTITGHVPAFVGLPTEPGGGSSVSGTVNQYLAAYPEARILSFGYSLGSGVIGSATITSITVGCTSYTFDGVMTGTATISGTPTVGQTLTATPGTWSPADVTFSYQWKSNGAPIGGATNSTYELTADDAGDTIVVVVTGSKSGYTSVDAISPGVTVGLGTLTTVVPVITGEAAIGSTLTANPGAWGPAPVSFGFQWLSDGVPIPGATDPTYLVTFSDAGNAISVTVTGSKAGYTSASQTSLPTVTLPTDAVPAVDRFAGDDRYETAVEISQEFFAGVGRVYLATGTNYPDALSAAAAGGYLGAPVLLTTPDQVPAIVLAELNRLAPDEIVIVGSAAAVSVAVETQVAGVTSDPTVIRIGGVDRFETSRMIAEDAFPEDATTAAYLATGLNFPDALAAGPAAAHLDGPVILINGGSSTVDSATLATLTDLGVDSVKIAGNSLAISSGIESQLDALYTVTRNQGANRFETAVAINEDAFATSPTVFIATGLNFPDALAGAALAGFEDAPLYVSTAECIPESVYESIMDMNPGRIVLLGGLPSLGAGVEDLIMCD